MQSENSHDKMSKTPMLVGVILAVVLVAATVVIIKKTNK
jgi:hypothetical protein